MLTKLLVVTLLSMKIMLTMLIITLIVVENHTVHAPNFPATANMQREEKKGKERSIYSGELVFEIKNDFVFPCVIKSFHFPCSN